MVRWDEWDGRGRDDAVAFAYGTWRRDARDEAAMQVRRLGLEQPEGTVLELEHGFICNVDGDNVPDACTSDGEALTGLGEYGDEGTVRAVTFAVYLEAD